jgi:uncharacterized protein
MAGYCTQCGSPTPEAARFCASCGEPVGNAPSAHASDMDRRRNRVLGLGEKPRMGWSRFAVAGVVLVSLGLWVYAHLPRSGSAVIANQPVAAPPQSYPRSATSMVELRVTAADGFLHIPLDVLLEKKLVAFRHSTPTGVIPLIAYVSGEGRIVTAISMCEPCNSERFHISGAILVCDACGSTWKLDTLAPVSGACGKYPPDALPNRLVAGQVLIETSRIEAWRRRA